METVAIVLSSKYTFEVQVVSEGMNVLTFDFLSQRLLERTNYIAVLASVNSFQKNVAYITLTKLSFQ